MNVTKEMIEAAAKAMCEEDGFLWNAGSCMETSNGEEPEEQREYWLDKAETALTAALSAQPAVAVPDGWEPTQEQTASACLSYRHDFGLMPALDREALMRTAQWWLEAWLKVSPAAPHPAPQPVAVKPLDADFAKAIYDNIEDLYEAVPTQPADLREENERLRQNNERWRQNSEDTWAAMTAMRNSINEHLPMPSIESDLLQGPDNSVFCAAIAEAVVSYITSAKQRVKALEGALEPFATSDMLGFLDRGKVSPDSCVAGDCDFTYRDLDNARAVYNRAALKGGE